MYLYDEIDQRLVDERVAQFRGQTRRFLDGKLSEDDFRALRLRNGLYVQRYAPMLRIAIPYGLLDSRQLRKLAEIADEEEQTLDPAFWNEPKKAEAHLRKIKDKNQKARVSSQIM